MLHILAVVFTLLCFSHGNTLVGAPATCNSDICVAVDNSIGLTPEQFNVQRSLVLTLLGALSNTTDASVLVLEYSSRNNVLVQPTNNFTFAASAVANTSYVGDRLSNLGGPLVLCDARLRHRDTKDEPHVSQEPEESQEPNESPNVDLQGTKQEPNQKMTRMKRILLFTGGLANLGGDPVVRANVFRERARGEIFAVSINNMNLGILQEITGDPRKVISVGNTTSRARSQRGVVDLMKKLC